MSFYKDKVVVVTGGSEGIGKALVDFLLQRGAKVATCSRNYDKLYDLQKLFPGKPLLIHAADVSNETDCQNFIRIVIKAYGTIDVLINNAGISMRALFSEVEVSTLKKVMDVNFWGAVYITKYALPYIIQQKGTIVGVSSIAGYRGLPGRTGYSASKFAMQGWLECLRTELMYHDVNVMWVCPGFTRSNIRNVALAKDGSPQGESPMDESRLMAPEDCAKEILRAIKHKKRTLVLTFEGKRTILVNRMFPRLADKLVYKYFFSNGKLVR